jgi:DNA-binding transcriptional regulator YiaG
MNKSEAVKALRQQLGLTQEQFAEVLHVSARTVSRWETGIAEPSRLAFEAFEQRMAKAREVSHGK